MKVQLDKSEMLEVLHNAFCNGGLTELQYCDVELDLDKKEYDKASKRLRKNMVEGEILCYEDVFIEMLKEGKTIHFKDYNDDTRIGFNIDKAVDALSKQDSAKEVLETLDGRDDAWTGFNLIQRCLYGDVIYG
tara:strand:+ start:243 stop:641 length:399 start_codon:yes stop_codon:yes gene_type:complete